MTKIKMMVVLTMVAFLIATIAQIATALPKVVPNDKGGLDFIFMEGPGYEITEGNRKVTKCPNPEAKDVHCHTVSTSILNSGPGSPIPVGTTVNVWVSTDANMNGVGYIGVNLTKDYDGSDDLEYEILPSTQTVYDYATWDALRPY